jgi:hypothetical protein
MKPHKRVNPTIWNAKNAEDQQNNSGDFVKDNYLPKKYFTIRRAELAKERNKNQETAKVAPKSPILLERKIDFVDKVSEKSKR